MRSKHDFGLWPRPDCRGGVETDGCGRAFRLGPRTGYCMFPDLPRNGHEAGLSIDKDLIAARRVYMANRGVWEAIWSAGTQVSFAHSRADLDRYLEVAEAFLAEIRC